MAGSKKPNEISITRVYDAPVKTVWEAWNDPAQVGKWWGPRGFTLTTHSKELKAGGIWHYTMHGPDGTDYINKTLYHEVIPLSKLVYDHGGNDERAPLFRVTALFKELPGKKTELQMTMAFPNADIAREMVGFIKKAGGNSTWDRLGEYLEKQASGKENFIINRSFEAPIETLFKMWTDPKHFARWLAPTGFEMEFLRADIRTGGSSFYKMTNGKDVTMYGRASYEEVTRPHRLVYTQSFCTADEKPARHPMAPTWPETMRTVVLLSEEGPDQTRVTITWSLLEGVTAEELQTFIQGRAGMTMGWTGSLDKLEELLRA